MGSGHSCHAYEPGLDQANALHDIYSSILIHQCKLGSCIGAGDVQLVSKLHADAQRHDAEAAPINKSCCEHSSQALPDIGIQAKLCAGC